MIIPKEFYTYQFIDGDLIIYTWTYLELWGDNEAAYTHPAGGEVTYVKTYNTEEEFEKENDVFLDRLDAVYHALGLTTDELIEVSLEEAKEIIDEEYEEALKEFYDINDEEEEE
jgi:hypothetical protein